MRAHAIDGSAIIFFAAGLQDEPISVRECCLDVLNRRFHSDDPESDYQRCVMPLHDELYKEPDVESMQRDMEKEFEKIAVGRAMFGA